MYFIREYKLDSNGLATCVCRFRWCEAILVPEYIGEFVTGQWLYVITGGEGEPIMYYARNREYPISRRTQE